MKKNSVPNSILELENWMKDNCYNFISYSINGNFIDEGFSIEKNGNLFLWYYQERGIKRVIKEFQSEKEVVEYGFNKILNDKWAKAHCIGFSKNEKDINDLVSIITGLDIEYFQDKITYDDWKPIFRVFVFGCDVNKLLFLKEKYYLHTKIM